VIARWSEFNLVAARTFVVLVLHWRWHGAIRGGRLTNCLLLLGLGGSNFMHVIERDWRSEILPFLLPVFWNWIDMNFHVIMRRFIVWVGNVER
jgi:hypothetical protein